MEFTTIAPTKPGLYMAKRPGRDVAICKIIASEDMVLIVHFIGEAIKRSIADVETVSPGIEYSCEAIDISRFEEFPMEVPDERDDGVDADGHVEDIDSEEADTDDSDVDDDDAKDTFEL